MSVVPGDSFLGRVTQLEAAVIETEGNSGDCSGELMSSSAGTRVIGQPARHQKISSSFTQIRQQNIKFCFSSVDFQFYVESFTLYFLSLSAYLRFFLFFICLSLFCFRPATLFIFVFRFILYELSSAGLCYLDLNLSKLTCGYFTFLSVSRPFLTGFILFIFP